jgi:hypothetical protein
MKKRFVLVLVFLLAHSAIVSAQPFSASIVIFPGCGLQFAYGQKACGQLTVSDDAWVTRWVEDEYGNTWYHWGTRYYTAGSHNFCGYMGLPIGKHVMKIYAVRVSDSAVIEDQCDYIVCCGYSVFMPHRPTCSCENVVFTTDVDKTQVTPGDYITVTVTVTNNMGADCKKKFDAGHLEIDWGILGGDTSPLEKDMLVQPGETRTILEETHLVPPVKEGDYNVVISYSDSECTWIDYAIISVELPTEGSFEILSYPDLMNVGEKGRAKVVIRNQSDKEAQFTLWVSAPADIYLPWSVYETALPRQGYEEVDVEFQPQDTGVFMIELELTSEGVTRGVIPISIKVEKPVAGTLEIISPPSDCTAQESTSVVLRVTNPGNYDTVYQISAATTGVTIPPIPELFVPKSEYRDVEIFLNAVEEGVHEVFMSLEAEGQLMDSKTVSFTAEKESSLWPIAIIVIIAGGLAGALIVYFVKK